MRQRKKLDKDEARARRDRLHEQAAGARLPLVEAVREMRAISGMTQDEFARHRGVGARVVKDIETANANPTVATLNRIGALFGLEVAFVPIIQPRVPSIEAPDEAASGQPSEPWRAIEAGMRLQQDTLDRVLARLERLDAGAAVGAAPRARDQQV